MDLQFDRVRDFLLLHYVATQRDDSEMWRYFRNMTLPQSLQEKLEAWERRGYVVRYEHGTFLPPSWVAVMMGQNLIPESYDARVHKFDFAQTQKRIETIKRKSKDAVLKTPDHAAYIEQFGAATSIQPLTASHGAA
jgi:tryptophan halogenase